MRSLITLLAVVAVTAVTVPVHADTTWTGLAGDGKYLTAGNWDNGLPIGTESAFIQNGDTVTVDGAGALAGTGWNKWAYVGGVAGDGHLRLVAGGDLAGAVQLAADGGTGTFVMTGGTWDASSKGIQLSNNAASYSKFELQGGDVTGAGYLVVGRKGVGELVQTGGSIATRADYPMRINAYSADGTYTLSGGSVTVQTMWLGYKYGSGGSATWNITNNAASIVIADVLAYAQTSKFILGGRSSVSSNPNIFLNAVTGTVIHMVGSSLENRCPGAAGADAQLVGLNNVTLLFEGTFQWGSPPRPDQAEVAGQDIGAVMAGLTNNFALEGLTLGGAAGVASLQLLDVVDNWQDGIAEALYVENLTIGTGSTLDVSGLNVYYLNLVLDGDVIDTVGGGGIYQIPEPATMLLLGMGGLGVLIRRRRRA